MKLLTAPPSPFGRKVKLVAHIKGLIDDIEVVPADTMSDPDGSLAAANPLGKIPVLLLEDGTAIFDSKVICEYLDAQSEEPVLFPRCGPERWTCLTRAAAADGVMEAAVLIVYEARFRPAEMRVASWVDRQREKIDRGLASFEAAARTGADRNAVHDYAAVTLACCLQYLDLRLGGDAWRPRCPSLVSWLDGFAAEVPGFAKTAPPT